MSEAERLTAEAKRTPQDVVAEAVEAIQRGFNMEDVILAVYVIAAVKGLKVGRDD